MIEIVKSGELTKTKRARHISSPAVVSSVADIIAGVSARGDEALREYTGKFDGFEPEKFEVPDSDIEAAMRAVGGDFIGVLRRAAKNIEEFHRNQIRQGFTMSPRPGVTLGQQITPLDRVGIYIPGGTAAYPSCVLMNCIPAKLAGVREAIIVTPPSKDGLVDAGILAAARIAGADRVFSIGGAQAIAALAYGTGTVPRVDKIVGPGNAYVAEAKRQVFGIVGIDMIAGPSDVLIIADSNADPALVAADMLSQCEHGSESIAVLITDDAELAGMVGAEIETQLADLPRESAARESIDKNGRIIIAGSIGEAFDISNEIAPEHIELFLTEPFKHLGMVRNAGSVFLGANSPVPLGDYYAGPNNTLPTSGTARFASPLSVDDFIKKSSFTYYSEEALQEIGGDIVMFASMEGLDAHARSITKRISK